MNNPKIPDAFHGIVGLGSLRSVQPARKWLTWGNLIICLILSMGAVLVFLYGVFETYLAYQQHGPAMIDDKLTVPLVIAIVMIVVGLLTGWGAYVNWARAAAVYEGGIAYTDRRNLIAWRWQDIVSMKAAITRHYTNGIYTGTTHVYTLFNRQNQKLILSDPISKVEEVGKQIGSNIFPILYEKAADQFNAGQILPFGPVAISKQSLTYNKKTFPWTDIKEISIRHGTLTVHKKEGGLFSGIRFAAASIPNLDVLLAIVQQVVGLKVG
jgi:hypothetical protein